MKIAQVAPLMESVPPRYYGGIERIASYVTEALVAQGHDVTLFASGDSVTSAALVPCCSKALRLNGAVRDWIPYHMVMLDKVRRRAHEFDVIHFHVDVLHFPLFRDIAHRTLTTLHGRQDLPDHVPFYAEFPEMPLAVRARASVGPSCNGCLLCVPACADGGFQAIAGVRGKIVTIDGAKCDGCGLCVIVCPIGSITMVPRQR